MKRLTFLLALVMGCSSAGSVAIDPLGGAAGTDGTAGTGTINPVGGPGGDGGASGGSGQDEGGAAGSVSDGGKDAGGKDAGGSGGTNAGTSSGGTSSGGTSSGGTSSGGTSSAGTSSGTAGTSSGDCNAQAQTAEVYGQSATELFRVDPETKGVKKVGTMVCGFGESVVDIALNKQGLLFGTTFSSLVQIDKTNAKCTIIKSGDSYPNSLSFVPVGTVFPDKEALVGYFGSQYVVIDTKTGAITTKGSLTGGYTSSGDIVSVIGGGTYLTVKGNECSDSDCLVQVDPATGDLIKKIGSVNHSDVFGLAYWANQLYGFTDGGQMFTYDLATNQASDVSIPNAPSGLSFYGAGSSTCARLNPIN